MAVCEQSDAMCYKLVHRQETQASGKHPAEFPENTVQLHDRPGNIVVAHSLQEMRLGLPLPNLQVSIRRPKLLLHHACSLAVREHVLDAIFASPA